MKLIPIVAILLLLTMPVIANGITISETPVIGWKLVTTNVDFPFILNINEVKQIDSDTVLLKTDYSISKNYTGTITEDIILYIQDENGNYVSMESYFLTNSPSEVKGAASSENPHKDYITFNGDKLIIGKTYTATFYLHATQLTKLTVGWGIGSTTITVTSGSGASLWDINTGLINMVTADNRGSRFINRTDYNNRMDTTSTVYNAPMIYSTLDSPQIRDQTYSDYWLTYQRSNIVQLWQNATTMAGMAHAPRANWTFFVNAPFFQFSTQGSDVYNTVVQHYILDFASDKFDTYQTIDNTTGKAIIAGAYEFNTVSNGTVALYQANMTEQKIILGYVWETGKFTTDSNIRTGYWTWGGVTAGARQLIGSTINTTSNSFDMIYCLVDNSTTERSPLQNVNKTCFMPMVGDKPSLTVTTGTKQDVLPIWITGSTEIDFIGTDKWKQKQYVYLTLTGTNQSTYYVKFGSSQIRFTSTDYTTYTQIGSTPSSVYNLTVGKLAGTNGIDVSFVVDSITNYSSYGVRSVSWLPTRYHTSESYDTTTIEGNNTLFVLSVKTNYTTGENITWVRNATLRYNGATYVPTANLSYRIAPHDYYNFSYLMAIPFSTFSGLSTTKNFYWNFTAFFNDSSANTSYVTDTVTQTIYGIYITNCSFNSSITSPITLTYNIYDEDTLLAISNTTLSQLFYVYSNPNNPVYKNFTFSQNNQSTYSYCIAPNFTTAYVNSLSEYLANGYYKRFYYADKLQISSDTQTVNLYLLNSSNANVQLVTATIYDTAGVEVEGAILKLLKLNTATNTYFTIAAIKTDLEGKAATYLELYEHYKPIIEKNGTILTEYNDLQQLTTALTLYLSATDYGEWFNIRGTLNYYCEVSDSAVTCTYSETSGHTQTVDLVLQQRQTIGFYPICNQTLTSSAGVLTCSIPNTTTSNYYIYTLSANYHSNPLYVVLEQGIKEFKETSPYGTAGVLVAMFIFLTLTFVALQRVEMVLIAGLAATVLSYYLNLYTISSMAIIWLVVAIAVIFWAKEIR